jgi:hypothetical protein
LFLRVVLHGRGAFPSEKKLCRKVDKPVRNNITAYEKKKERIIAKYEGI